MDVDPTLYFTFRDNPNHHPTLAVPTGANSITWDYGLKTQTIPTYGGEVKQILGINIGNMTITGNSQDNRQLYDIYDWFRGYMVEASGFARAGGLQRSEVSVLFRYPARGWEFDIQILEAPEYKLATDLLATEWKVVAFVVPSADKLHVLEAATMSQFNESLAIKDGRWSIPIGVGYVALNKFSQDLNPDFASLGRNLGDNFQRFVGGGFVSHWAGATFDGVSPHDGTGASASDYWTNTFGGEVIPLLDPSGHLVSGNSTSGTVSLGGSTGQVSGDLSGLSGLLTGAQVAALAFQQGVGNTSASDTSQLVLAVAIAHAENSWYVGGTPNFNPGPPPTYDYGVWQINTVHTPPQGPYDPQLLQTNPVYNAKAMYAISNHGTNWSPWSTYNSGAYKQFMSISEAAVKQFLANPADPSGPAGATPAAWDTLNPNTVAKALANDAEWVKGIGLPEPYQDRRCDHWCALAYGHSSSGSATAFVHWTDLGALGLHHTSGTPPAGALVFWPDAAGGGSGHIAISTGDGSCYSTDFPVDGAIGHVTLASIDAWASAWGGRLGWTEPKFLV